MGFGFELFDEKTLFYIETIICKNILNLDLLHITKLCNKYYKSKRMSIILSNKIKTLII